MKLVRTHYDNLKVSRDAPKEVITAAYHSLCNKYAPDKSVETPESSRILSIINRAYKVLSDPEQRKRHDEWIVEQESQSTKGSETETFWNRSAGNLDQASPEGAGRNKTGQEVYSNQNKRYKWLDWANSDCAAADIIARELAARRSLEHAVFAYLQSYDNNLKTDPNWKPPIVTESWLISAIKYGGKTFLRCAAEYDRRFLVLQELGKVPYRTSAQAPGLHISSFDECETLKFLELYPADRYENLDPNILYNFPKSIEENNFHSSSPLFRQLNLFLGLSLDSVTQDWIAMYRSEESAGKKNFFKSLFGSSSKSSRTEGLLLDLGSSHLGRAIRTQIWNLNILSVPFK